MYFPSLDDVYFDVTWIVLYLCVSLFMECMTDALLRFMYASAFIIIVCDYLALHVY